MLKIRLQGTSKDINLFIKLLKDISHKSGILSVISCSKPFTNKGTNKYLRLYIDVDITE